MLKFQVYIKGSGYRIVRLLGVNATHVQSGGSVDDGDTSGAGETLTGDLWVESAKQSDNGKQNHYGRKPSSIFYF